MVSAHSYLYYYLVVSKNHANRVCGVFVMIMLL